MAGVRQFDEDSAFEQALDIFWAKGFRVTSMLDLARSTGVQRGSLYNAYGDKEEIFLRVFERYAERFIVDAREALNKRDLRTALTDFLCVRNPFDHAGLACPRLPLDKNRRRDRPRIAAPAGARNEDARRARKCIAWCP
ncbi:TetR/AcrR family transcriptional regulator [Paraburkholderia sp. GAS348]|uniref:TetR/AcrR family transcriptional regulator n=1 Tax=Paraburkholderia sp. GAS348 TaxID=3035132 RepID=UPI003D1E528D